MVAFSAEFVVLTIAYVLVIIGFVFKPFRLMKYLGAFMMLSISVVMISTGVAGFTNLLTDSVGYISIGLGFWFLMHDYFARDEQGERFEEVEDDGRFHDND